MSFRILCLATLLSACATPRDSSIHRGTFEESSYETVFGAFQSILESEGYVLEKKDRHSGTIVARIEHPSVFGGRSEVLAIYGGGDSSSFYDFPQREGYEVSVSLAPRKATEIEAQLKIQKVEFYEQGGSRASSVEDKDSYRSLFDKVRLEIERNKLRRGRA